MVTGRRRAGLGILAIALGLAAACGIIALSYHALWRGTSRTLFSIQESRELQNLARSALAEAHFQLQCDLDASKQKWFEWCTSPFTVAPLVAAPATTRQNSSGMTNDATVLRYTTSDVSLMRVRRVDAFQAGGEMGIVDLRVTVEVHRENVQHHAKLTVVERRNFWFADDLGPYGSGGRRIELSATPVGTVLEL